MLKPFLLISAGAFALVFALAALWAPALWLLALLGPLFVIGVLDATQTRQTVRRNFPLIGHGRYLLEALRPEINQYFVESNTDGTPFSREQRSLVYQRAKGELDTLPFGTQRDVYAAGYEFIAHSIGARTAPPEPRILIGAESCEQPYEASLLNVGAMSFGALSSQAVLALSRGASLGGFAVSTGEGGLSPYHLEGGGDLVWQLGTGYFGARDAQGRFDADRFEQRASHPRVRMIELKLSQGAKPGHGGILPAAKLTAEIAAIRGVPMGQDVLSPPSHSAFATPLELVRFVGRLRRLAGGKPVGIKLCVGEPSEFLALCKAMVETGIVPDYIAVDGGEGGTGAAPLEFSNAVGMPLVEGLVLVHDALVGFGLRQRVRIIASGKVVTGFHMASRLALGADLFYSARGMMLALGCIQARRCNSNHCPVGIATQNPSLVRGLVVEPKAERVRRFQRQTVESLLEILGAAGLSHPRELSPWHIQRRGNDGVVRSYAELYPGLEEGALLREPLPRAYERAWRAASAERFGPRPCSLVEPPAPLGSPPAGANSLALSLGA